MTELSVASLSKSFGAVQAVDNVSFTSRAANFWP